MGYGVTQRLKDDRRPLAQLHGTIEAEARRRRGSKRELAHRTDIPTSCREQNGPETRACRLVACHTAFELLTGLRLIASV
jgi:hypothetical protein